MLPTLRLNLGSRTLSSSSLLGSPTVFRDDDTIASRNISMSEQHLFLVHARSDRIADLSASLGWSVVSYIPDNTLLVLATGKYISRLMTVDGVKWVNVMPADLKLSRVLDELSSSRLYSEPLRVLPNGRLAAIQDSSRSNEGGAKGDNSNDNDGARLVESSISRFSADSDVLNDMREDALRFKDVDSSFRDLDIITLSTKPDLKAASLQTISELSVQLSEVQARRVEAAHAELQSCVQSIFQDSSQQQQQQQSAHIAERLRQFTATLSNGLEKSAPVVPMTIFMSRHPDRIAELEAMKQQHATTSSLFSTASTSFSSSTKREVFFPSISVSLQSPLYRHASHGASIVPVLPAAGPVSILESSSLSQSVHEKHVAAVISALDTAVSSFAIGSDAAAQPSATGQPALQSTGTGAAFTANVSLLSIVEDVANKDKLNVAALDNQQIGLLDSASTFLGSLTHSIRYGKRTASFQKALSAATPSVSAPAKAVFSSLSVADAQAAYRAQLTEAAATVLRLQGLWVAAAAEHALHTIAKRSDVFFVDQAREMHIHNNRARWVMINGKDPIPDGETQYADQLTAYHSRGLTGKGIVTGASDTGLDDKSCFFTSGTEAPSFASVRPSHRKISVIIPFGDFVDYANGHGTHVVGSIVGSVDPQYPGNKSQATNAMVDHAGIAPDARISFMDIGVGRSLVVPSPLTYLHEELIIGGADITSHSWGCAYSGQYQMGIDSCNAYDARTFYTDKVMKYRDSHLVLFSAGNDGRDGYATVGSPATAKNIICVGASTRSRIGAMQTPALSPQRPETNVVGDPNSNDNSFYRIRNLAAFSSKGPTYDNRYKPDVVSVGAYVFSAASSDGYASTRADTCEVSMKQGTSMATPVLNGITVLLKDYFQRGFYPTGVAVAANQFTPSGALLKSVLINSAQDVDYVQISARNVPVPMFKQPMDRPTVAGAIFVAMGSTFSVQGSRLLYISPTAHDASLQWSASRSAYIILQPVEETCTGDIRVVVTPDFPASTTPSFNETGRGSRIIAVNEVTIGQNTSISVQTANTECIYQLTVLEYDASSVTTALKKRKVACSTSFNDIANKWANVNLKVANITADATFICPDPTHCLNEAVAEGPTSVVGTTWYRSTSKLCATAIHSGALNPDVTGPQAFTATLRVLGDVETFEFFGTKRYGITSGDALIDTSREFAGSVQVGVDVEPNIDLMPISQAPNKYVGFGQVHLLAATPFDVDAGDTATHVSRRLYIAADGVNHAITHKSYTSYCFSTSALKEAVNEDVGPERTKVTLAWADYHADPSASVSLVNDLDLHLFGPGGEEWRGNNVQDNVNNVEQVWLRGRAASGIYCAVVHGRYVPLGSQKYALTMTGRKAQACEPNTDGINLGGSYNVIHNTCEASAFPATTSSATYSVLQAGKCVSFRLFTTNGADFFGLRRSVDAEAGPFASLGLSLSGRISGVAPDVTFSLTYDHEGAGTPVELAATEIDASKAEGTVPEGALRVFSIVPSSGGCRVEIAQVSQGIDVQDKVVKPEQHLIDEPEVGEDEDSRPNVTSSGFALSPRLVFTVVLVILGIIAM